ncbi:SecC domain-containing protein-containing protein OS=Streptomyces glaucescens OX=1907 GN=SGLAU_16650 PE=4 SV=1 [Streptomyces glaucescens]
MAKKQPQTKAKRPQITDGEIPVVGAREPCPCGSGRRYKACHGRAAAQAVTELVHRPFEGLPGECDWVALRELVPAATAELTLKDGLPEGVPSVTLATVLPMAWPALRREDGSVLLGLQNDTASGDISRDLADTLQRALQAKPGTPVQGRRARPAARGCRTCSTPRARSSRRCTAASSSGFRTRRTPPRR